MQETPSHFQIRKDVALVMAKTVIEKTGFSQSTYHGGIIPSQEPLDGFGASLSFWAYLLGIVEARLEAKAPQYAVFDVTANFARATKNIQLRETNQRISRLIEEKISGMIRAEEMEESINEA